MPGYQGSENEWCFVRYAQLYAQAKIVASGLLEYFKDSKVPDKLILAISDNLEFLVAFWSCQLLGVTPILLNPALLSQNLEKIGVVCADFPEVALIISSQAKNINFNFLSLVPLVVSDLITDKVFCLDELKTSVYAAIFLTSGSTGKSKYVLQTHNAIFTTVVATVHKFRYFREDVFYNWLTLSHAAPLILYHLVPLFVKANQYQANTNYILSDIKRWMCDASSFRVSSTWAPNFAYKNLVLNASGFSEMHLDLSSIRVSMNGGELIDYQTLVDFCSVYLQHGFDSTALMPAYLISICNKCFGQPHAYGRAHRLAYQQPLR